MSNPGLWQEEGTTFRDRSSQALVACLAFGWLFVIATHDSRPAFSSRFECGSDPWDILRIGELLEPSSLAFIVEAHCSNAKYSPDGWIELKYGGARFDVELRRVDVGGATYFKIVSIGGITAP
jgi:hypothetical protein